VTTSKSELVALLYRADWTTLSLSATVAWSRDRAVDWRLLQRKLADVRDLFGPLPTIGRPDLDNHPDDDDGPWRDREQHVLLAPGGRYRVEDADGSPVSLGDGQHHWEIHEGTAERGPADGPPGALRGLVTPRWLIACYDLDITGPETVGGRAAIRVTGTPRAVRPGRRAGLYDLLDRVTVLVDAELGILLRSEQVFEGLSRDAAELRDLITDPDRAGEAGRFAPPPGAAETEDDWQADHRPDGAGWRAAGAAASLTASAMGFAVRHAPRHRGTGPATGRRAGQPPAPHGPADPGLRRRAASVGRRRGRDAAPGRRPRDHAAAAGRHPRPRRAVGGGGGAGRRPRRAPGRPAPGQGAGPVPARLHRRRLGQAVHQHCLRWRAHDEAVRGSRRNRPGPAAGGRLYRSPRSGVAAQRVAAAVRQSGHAGRAARVPPAGRDHRDGRRQRRPSLYARGSGRGHRARDRRAPDDLRPTSATSRRPAPSCGS
jgi:hypothetical protein